MSIRPSLTALVLALSLAGFCESAGRLPLPGLPVEAPTSLFYGRMAGNGGELTANGSWELSLLSSASLSLSRTGGLVLGQLQPLLFKQTPDILLSFILDERWYVDARVSPDGGQSRYAAGYRGTTGELLREVRVGNSGIGLPALPFVSFGEGGAYSFGALVKAGDQSFGTTAILRYDQADRVRRSFRGSTEIAEAILTMDSYIRGRWFLLVGQPDVAPVVYVESVSGGLVADDGSRWRLLSADEYRLLGSNANIELDSQAKSRISIGLPGLIGANIAIQGIPARIIFDPTAVPASEEVLSHYPRQGKASEFFVRDRASGRRDDDFVVVPDSDGNLELLSSMNALAPLPRPFEALVPDFYARVPEALGGSHAELDAFEIVALDLSSSDTITVDLDIIPGSIELLRDGVADQAFDLDVTRGRLVLLRPPASTEAIELSYLRQSSERRSGSLTGGLVADWTGEGGLAAWLALAGHLGLPGLGFAEAGQTDPASMTLSLGTRKDQGPLTWKAAIAGTLGFAESTGRYRIEGMEAAGDFGTSFWPRPSSAGSDFTFAEVADAGFAQQWPRLSGILHADGRSSKVLTIGSTLGGDLTLEKIVDKAPVSGFGSLVLFMRSTGGSGGTIRISLDRGSEAERSFRLELPLALADGAWRRFRLDLGTGAVSMTPSEGADEIRLPSIAGSHDPLVVEASRLVIELSGLGPGGSVDLDEILLEDPRGSTTLDFSAASRWSLEASAKGGRPLGLIKRLVVSGDASGGLASTSFADAGSNLDLSIGPLSLGAGLRGLLDGGALTLRGNHDVSLGGPALPFAISDRFSWDAAAVGFGRGNHLELRGGELASLAIDTGSQLVAASTVPELAGLSQDWKAALRLGSLVKLDATAKQRVPSEAPSSSGGYFPEWVNAFKYVLPVAESMASSRSLTMDGGIGADILSARLVVAGRSDAVAARSDDFLLRLGVPLPPIAGIRLLPAYARAWTDRRPGADAGLGPMALAGASSLVGLGPLWLSLPFEEFWGAAPVEAFRGLMGTGLMTEMKYTAVVTLGLARDPGSNLFDLIVPAAVSLSWKRELSTKGVELRDAGIFAGKLDFAALELFGTGGWLPLFRNFASDEYHGILTGGFEVPAGASAASAWNAGHQLLVTLFGLPSRPGDRILFDNRLAWSSGHSGNEWSEKLGLDLSSQVSRSLLLDAFGSIARLLRQPSESPSASLDSAFLRSVLEGQPRARNVLSLDGTIKGSTQDESAATLAFAFDEAWESRISIPERLSAFARFSATQSLDTAGNLGFGIEASLGLTLSF